MLFGILLISLLYLFFFCLLLCFLLCLMLGEYGDTCSSVHPWLTVEVFVYLICALLLQLLMFLLMRKSNKVLANVSSKKIECIISYSLTGSTLLAAIAFMIPVTQGLLPSFEKHCITINAYVCTSTAILIAGKIIFIRMYGALRC